MWGIQNTLVWLLFGLEVRFFIISTISKSLTKHPAIFFQIQILAILLAITVVHADAEACAYL